MSVFHNNALIGAGGGAAAADAAVATKSLRFNSGDSAHLSKTFSSAGNRKKWTWSAWIKIADFTASDPYNFVFGAGASDEFYICQRSSQEIHIRQVSSGSEVISLITDQEFRDVGGWGNLVVAVDTGQATSSNRIKVYWNGSQITSFSTSSYPSQNLDTHVSNNVAHYFGKRPNGTIYLDAYLADCYLIDGSQLDPTSFGAYDDSGVWQAAAYSGTYGTNGFKLLFDSSDLGEDSSGNSNTFTANNLAASAPGLSTADQGFGVLTYTGNATARNISGLSFAPDLVIIKSRSDSGFHHYWMDRVRGSGKNLFSNLTEGEQSADRLSSFNSDGIGLTDHAGVNKSGSNFVAWCWKAGGSASSNSNGTITSSVSASTTYGFSVVGYTGNNTSGATVGHGLSSAPKWIVVKSRDQNGQFWHVYHASLGANEYIYLNSNAVKTSGNDFMNGTRPTSSVFSLGNGNACNKSSDPVIAYCWSEVSGFSKFDGFSGDGNSGKKITTGFKPKFVIIKRTDTIENWHIFDSERGGTKSLFPDLGNAEVDNSSRSVAFVSDGFTLGTQGGINASGGTYIYAAFADVPNGADIDSLFDVPTNGTQSDTGAGGEVSGNYAVLNPLNKHASSDTISNGNLQASWSGGSACIQPSTLAFSSGKYYYEFSPGISGSIGNGVVGIRRSDSRNHSNTFAYLGNGQKMQNESASSYGSSYTDGDVIGVAVDMDAGTIRFYKNGADQGQAYSGISGTYTFYQGTFGGSTGGGYAVNFGQRAFAYSAPSGFKALCTTNLPTPTIADGSDYFDILLWTGDGASSTRTITGLSMANAPDWIWAKERNGGSSHALFDAVRGFGTNNVLKSNSTDAEGVSNGGYINSTSTSSITWAQGTSTAEFYDANGKTYVAWCWDAGSSTVSNTDGSITSSVRANQSAGFSIVTFNSGSSDGDFTCGHGLNTAPELILMKSRSRNGGPWWVFHRSVTDATTKYLQLSTTGALITNSGGNIWGSSLPTSSVFGFSVGAGKAHTQSETVVSYCFAPVAGYSAFGSYEGNNNADGPFLYTGFRPAFFLVKNVDASQPWNIYDSSRDIDNVVTRGLQPNNSIAEYSSTDRCDFLSNGIKIKSSGGTVPNLSGNTYIYAAFAENPFQANGGLAR